MIDAIASKLCDTAGGIPFPLNFNFNLSLCEILTKSSVDKIAANIATKIPAVPKYENGATPLISTAFSAPFGITELDSGKKIMITAIVTNELKIGLSSPRFFARLLAINAPIMRE